MSGPYKLELRSRISDIPAADWDACAGPDNPFVSHAFLSALEESGSTGESTGWIPQHAVLRVNDKIVGVAPMYAKTHSYGEYVFDQGWADALERAGGDYYPKLQVAVPFTPVSGPRLLRRPGVPVAAMGEAIATACAHFEMSSAHVTFCLAEEYDALGEVGWLQRLGLQYHWHNDGYHSFDDFLAALSSNHRKTIRRERRDVQGAGLPFRTVTGGAITEKDWDAFYVFYQSTVDRKWGSAYLTRDFFSLLSQKLSDKVVLMLAEYEGRPVAGALNLVGGDTLYGRNWGCIGDWPFLHFELCYYRAIDYAIEHGLRRVEAGAQGQHKIKRGYLPQLTYSAHHIAHPAFAKAVKSFLEEERADVLKQKQALSRLSPFRNQA